MVSRTSLVMWLLAATLCEVLATSHVTASPSPSAALSTPTTRAPLTDDVPQCGPLSCRALALLGVIVGSSILAIVLVAVLIATDCCHQCDQDDDDAESGAPLLRGHDDDSDEEGEVYRHSHKCTRTCVAGLHRLRWRCQQCWRQCRGGRQLSTPFDEDEDEDGEGADGRDASVFVAGAGRHGSRTAPPSRPSATHEAGPDDDGEDGLVLVLPVRRLVAPARPARDVTAVEAPAWCASHAAAEGESSVTRATPPQWLPAVKTLADRVAPASPPTHSASDSSDSSDSDSAPVQPAPPTLRSGSATVSISSRSSYPTSHHEEPPQPTLASAARHTPVVAASSSSSSFSSPAQPQQSQQPLQPQQPQQPQQPLQPLQPTQPPQGFYWPREVKLDANFRPISDQPVQPPPRPTTRTVTPLPSRVDVSLSSASSRQSSTTSSAGPARRRARAVEPWQPVAVPTTVAPATASSAPLPHHRHHHHRDDSDGDEPRQPTHMPVPPPAPASPPPAPVAVAEPEPNELLADDLMYTDDYTGVMYAQGQVAGADALQPPLADTASSSSSSSSCTESETSSPALLEVLPETRAGRLDGAPSWPQPTAMGDDCFPSADCDFLMDDLSLAATADMGVVGTGHEHASLPSAWQPSAAHTPPPPPLSSSAAVPTRQTSADRMVNGEMQDELEQDAPDPRVQPSSSLHIFSGSTTSASSMDTPYSSSLWNPLPAARSLTGAAERSTHATTTSPASPASRACPPGVDTSAEEEGDAAASAELPSTSVSQSESPLFCHTTPPPRTLEDMQDTFEPLPSTDQPSVEEAVPVPTVSAPISLPLTRSVPAPARFGARSAKAHHRQREGSLGRSWGPGQRAASPGSEGETDCEAATAGVVQSVDPRFYGATTHQSLFRSATAPGTDTAASPAMVTRRERPTGEHDGDRADDAPGLFRSTSVGGFGRTKSLTSHSAGRAKRTGDADTSHASYTTTATTTHKRHGSAGQVWQFPWSDGVGGYHRTYAASSCSSSSMSSSLVSGGSASTVAPVPGSHGTTSEHLSVSTPSGGSIATHGTTQSSRAGSHHAGSVKPHSTSQDMPSAADVAEAAPETVMEEAVPPLPPVAVAHASDDLDEL